jgi:riboflavin synthase
MFTGIVEATGQIVGRTETDDGLRLRVAAPFADELEHGQSVAVSGACLTVEDRVGSETRGRAGEAGERDADSFSLFLSQETVDRTYLGELVEGDAVNLERALPADGRFDGHFVQGHVDGVGEVVEIAEVGEDWVFTFSLPESLARYVVEKGSVAVDGISLTVADLREGEFTVAVIPSSYEITNLHEKAVGDPVHLEVDVVAKYVESLTEGYRSDSR